VYRVDKKDQFFYYPEVNRVCSDRRNTWSSPDLSNRFKLIFENFLWKSRHLVLISIVASMVMSIGMFYVATVDTFSLVKRFAAYVGAPDGQARVALRDEIVSYLVKGIDGYLVAIVVLVLGLGLYELFIGRIDPASDTRFASNILKIESLSDLKQRLARLILLILMVEFFRTAVEIEFTTPLELLYLALGIALIGAAIYLGHSGEGQNNRQ
jgi:uncharacterized membrane protein YqhA